jgi:hypothetical protein
MGPKIPFPGNKDCCWPGTWFEFREQGAAARASGADGAFSWQVTEAGNSPSGAWHGLCPFIERVFVDGGYAGQEMALVVLRVEDGSCRLWND